MTPAKILIVEDEGIVALDIKNKLESLGYAVTGLAVSGEAAIEQALQTRPDLVLMDIQLKGEMDGIEAAEQIRARFDVPIVYLTAYADYETLKRAKITEPFGYILKPFDDPSLRSIIEMALYKHQMETALKESEKKFRSLAEQSPNMIFINQGGQVVYANQRCEEMMGYTRETFYADDFDFMSLIVPEDKALIERNFNLHRQGHDVEPYEYTLLTKEGNRIEVIITTKLIDYGGEKAILGIITDISQHKRAERTLQFTNAILSTQQETSPDGILVVDQSGRMISFNQRFVEMWGIPPAILERRSDQRALQVVQKKVIDPDAFLAKIEYLYQHPQEKSRDEINLVDGRVFERYSAPMLGTDGQYYGRVWYFRDATEAKRAEQTLLEHTAELQARNEELNAFAHTVAHDLKNPLALVIGFSETLVQTHAELPEGEIQKYLRLIAQNSRKLENIIDELLLLAQIREEEICLTPLDMGSIVAEAQQRLAHLVEQRQATIVAPPAESWPRALGYGPWVEEVWGNYISNAIQHSGDSPRVELGFDPPGAREARFWVQDDGPGIPPDKQAKLFVPFTRLTQARSAGHGLGLSIVRRIVEKLGGQVGVESPGLPGQGSLFSFTLPLADPEPES